MGETRAAAHLITYGIGSHMPFSFRRIYSGILLIATSLAVASCVPVSETSGLSAVAARPLAPHGAPATMARRDLPPLIEEALAELDEHSARVARQDRIGVVDFSLPSSEPRFHIVEVATGRIERSYLVAHGSGSDPAGTGMVHSFSNRNGSNASSRGAYVTANRYSGKHGLSRRLIGLDPENNMALDRAIVIHGADYVDPALIESQGRIGRSQGCFAFERGEVEAVMELLGEGRMIYAGKPA